MRRSSTRRRAALYSLGLLSLGALLAWTTLPAGSDPLSTVAVTRGDIESSVTALGTLQPRRYVDVGAQASGQIRKLHVEVGDQVKEGQLLVEIDPSTQQAKLDAGRFSIENLNAQLDEQKAQYQWPSNSTSASATLPLAGQPAKRTYKVPRPNSR